ncbi:MULTISPECIES: HAD family hydrolase [unclassified Pseudoalteromonas]|jgi:HAD superfamily hydrolase (TIGR01509 family)|uniref:HAD family hydrolase n=1 Tax=unclassified Pseudoalteromonas TaxID=194690 RepID=UPI001108015C|nr:MULTISPECIES: HAD family hydrolase [unclassified Pseudoalteromonas]TMN84728.1 phosphatase [Pseudoalteromonas sp. S410]TMN91055.1 phosphatase [Pseudoalteromonas sp. S408]TMN97934.1 phosphatase [Pseudoalteromonas sp. S407]TMO01268.1 phosphatase [Pseudoalteromonas sp. S409]TMO09263.1 phosphatase [Pseudoalteromonas sp. S186]
MTTQVEAIHGVIFDLDGTLVSSELDFSLIKAQIGCPDNEDLLDFIAELPSPYMREEAMNIVHQHELLDAQHATLLPGVSEAIALLHERNIPMAIVTRNFDKAAALKLKNNPLPISTVLTRSDAPAKPDPSALNAIATLWNISADNLLYVGDYLYDIQAAHNAKMRACLYAPDETPSYADQADYVLHDFYDLVALVESYAKKVELC